MFAHTDDNGEPIAIPSSCRYISNPIPKKVVSTRKVNISIRLSSGVRVRSSSKGSAVSLSCITANVSVGTFVNRVTTSRLTNLLEWMGSLLILTPMWEEFLTYDGDLQARGLMVFTRKRLYRWLAEPRLLTMGVNWIPSLCIFGRQ